MSLRTPNPLTNYQTQLDLQRSKERMAVLSEQLSSGNRIVRLGDDPTGSALILDFQNSIARNNDYVKQATTASTFLQVSETSMSSLNDSITRLLEIGQQGLSDTTGASGRTQIASEVDGIQNNILSISNSQSQGKYIFAGTKTTTKPFTNTTTYVGDSNSIDLTVSSSTSISTNLTGDAVFFGGPAGQGTATDLFQQVADLSAGLKSNNTAQIQAAYDNLKTIQSRINNQITDLGGRQSTLDQLKSDFQSYNQSLQSIQSSYQALDYPTAITEYSTEQISQQAALSTISSVNKRNLFDYLG